MTTETTDWKTVEELTVPHVWYLKHETSKGLEAMVKYDGCVHIFRRYELDHSGRKKESDYIHICDLEDFIGQLTDLRDLTDDFRED